MNSGFYSPTFAAKFYCMDAIRILIIIFFSTFTGWFISWLTLQVIFRPLKPVHIGKYKLQGLIPAKQAAFAAKIGSQVQSTFLAYKGLDEKLADPALLEKLKPEIEAHVDHFLQEKLKEVFPILAQFMGEKTINQFKTAFLTEIDNLLPTLIRNYTNDLKKQLRLDIIVSDKINELSMAGLQESFYINSRKETRLFQIACSCIGLLTGIITALVLILINI